MGAHFRREEFGRDNRKTAKQWQDEGPRDASCLPRREKPCIGAAGADLEVHAFGAAGAVTDVGRVVAVGVNSRVNIAAGEMHTDKGLGLTLAAAGRRIVRTKVEVFAFVVHKAFLARISR